MTIITVGIDLAKNVFAVHGVDDNGKPALVKPKVARADLLPLIAQLPPCVIGMEACSGAHHWAYSASTATPSNSWPQVNRSMETGQWHGQWGLSSHSSIKPFIAPLKTHPSPNLIQASRYRQPPRNPPAQPP